MILPGIHAVAAALEAANRRIHVIYYLRQGHRVDAILGTAEGLGIPLKKVNRQKLDTLCEGVTHQGIAAKTEEMELRHWRSLENPLPDTGSRFVAVDEVTDPRNLGAIIRSAEAFGWDGLLLPKDHVSAITPATIKAAAGATEWLKIYNAGNLAQTLKQLEKEYWIFGLDPEGSEDLHSIPKDQLLIVVLGAEGKGIRPVIRKVCHEMVKIPLLGSTASLNVSVAAAIVFYEMRQG